MKTLFAQVKFRPTPPARSERKRTVNLGRLANSLSTRARSFWDIEPQPVDADGSEGRAKEIEEGRELAKNDSFEERIGFAKALKLGEEGSDFG
jgi:hypothetical protein